jgi:hypothetical protein
MIGAHNLYHPWCHKCLQSIVDRPMLIATSQWIACPVSVQLWNLSSIDSGFIQELLRHGNLPSHSSSSFGYL